MKAIQGNLPQDQEYELISIQHGKLADLSIRVCENCGNTIANIAIVKGKKNNKEYAIGLDCAEILCKMTPSETREAKNRLNRETKFFRHLKKDCKCILVDKENHTAYSYTTIKEKWDIGATYRFSYDAYAQIIEKLNIPIVWFGKKG